MSKLKIGFIGKVKNFLRVPFRVGDKVVFNYGSPEYGVVTSTTDKGIIDCPVTIQVSAVWGKAGVRSFNRKGVWLNSQITPARNLFHV